VARLWISNEKHATKVLMELSILCVFSKRRLITSR